jgi:hypothetical protein
MISRTVVISIFCGVLCLSAIALGAVRLQGQQSDHKETQSESSHAEHDAMMSRGQQGMGFSQTKTTHHFLLKPDGGVIRVTANDPKDVASRDQIRMHLRHIAHAFAQGDFDIPMFVHDKAPPGVPVMKRLTNEIEYQFRKNDSGGEVVIHSSSVEAIGAIHDFLVFQIREHKTGDSEAVASTR